MKLGNYFLVPKSETDDPTVLLHMGFYQTDTAKLITCSLKIQMHVVSKSSQ